ncbi:SusC/RagA family TonB-linked outer membrane protein [Flavitalea sp. BT771]|uniref:SusC/RagA family TonB-linked outer membrane protein n=1 Tax=Flavitalea sp. BT771 TaxID=3063329 RepID=UPI0026E3DACE|nr:SusC/RagA family TonB-linked outer membrane protein [Flavitalea sp. BT771]MDO6430057.1 SusC/RagA family TonB-linked outer membrane protein [Flavitalea sp. BT771]MDV6219804.1 SusC/RagA family TonB-linked outer membrane protein [Flavitalea sp. BT771]
MNFLSCWGRLFVTIGLLHICAVGISQTVTISVKNCRIDSVFSVAKKQTGYVFFCSSDILNEVGPVSIDARNMDIDKFLDKLFSELPLKYTIRNKTIIVSKKAGATPAGIHISHNAPAAQPPDPNPQRPPILGLIRGRDGRPLVGASVLVKGTKQGASTDPAGRFTIEAKPGQILVVSYIGYKTAEVRILSNKIDLLDIVLDADDERIEEVVINTGIIKRDKASFTGAATVYTGAQLKTVGNRNVLESLRSLDPAFIKVENNLQGSNPNTMPTFEIRGQTTINTNTLNGQFSQDPNQPLFILDGFETTLQIIHDLDMNRVASITILKDAASTALYGAKAANGVVVVETKRAVPGKLQMSYTADLTFEIPDLHSYNLMNAAEKLEYERLHGFFYDTTGPAQWRNEEKYNHRLAEIKRGVNTYWLNEPLRTGLSHRHSLQFAGGNSDLMFNASLSMGRQIGVMKGSGRGTWGGNIGVSYRKDRLNLYNTLSLSGVKADESPYGSFAKFAEAIPYYRKTLPDGTVGKYLDGEFDPTIINPLYNVSFSGINETKSFSFFDNLDAVYTLSARVRLQAGIQLSKAYSKNVGFVPPENTLFDNADLQQKGSYTQINDENYAYRGYAMLSYGEIIGKHQLSATVRGDLSEVTGESRGFSAVGFPYGSDGNPIYAYSYTPFGTPTASNAKARSAGLLASFNYAWDRRFLFDAVYRLDGASVFGTDHVFKPFLSGGLGWNLHQEAFLKKMQFFSLLKLRVNAGYTGNENLGQFSSISTYRYQTGNNNAFGQGITVYSLGNPTVDWQRTLQVSYGIDLGFWNNRVSGYIEYFDKKTDPLTIGAEGTLPSSVGTGSNYVINAGYLSTKGWNMNIRVQPVNIPSKGIVWSIGIMGSRYKSLYGGLADKLAKLNEDQTKSQGLLRFTDGYSPDDIWAVVSHGVDPATGKELLGKKDGTISFDYSTDDIVKVGNSRPKIEGGISTTFTYKNLSLNSTLRYRIGGYVFNNALYNKVENVGYAPENLDKRALYDRWKKPGDIAQFTDIKSTAANLTSRFIQEDNHLIGESFSLSWRTDAKWLQQLKLQSLSITMYMNDIFRLEKIKTERGIDYPYARTASLSINVSF